MRKVFLILSFSLFTLSFTVIEKPFSASFIKTDNYGEKFKGKIYYNGNRIMMITNYPNTQYFLIDSISYSMYLPEEKAIYEWRGKSNYIFSLIKGDTTNIRYKKIGNGFYCGKPRVVLGIDSFYVWKNKGKIDSVHVFLPDSNVYRFVFTEWENGPVDSERMHFPVNYDSVNIIKE